METRLLPVPRGPSDYERRALREIQAWKIPPETWLTRTIGRFNTGLHAATNLVRKLPGIDWTIDNVVSGVLQLTNEIVHDSVWRDAIFKEYRTAGHLVRSTDDIRLLDLEVIDGVMQGLDTKYRSLTAAQGAVAGTAGAAGIVPDVVGLVALNLRALGEYATYCGFDIAEPAERLFAFQILNVVSQPADASTEEAAAVVSATAVSRSVAQQQTVQTVEQFALSGAIRNIARALGVRLTGSKLAQVLPMTGAFIGGSFNAYYTTRVCETAFNLYRERLLLVKYGPEVLVGEAGSGKGEAGT